jgi:branched-chain amino acid transport system permease protein/neutral amino acid transport system permease protein
MSQVTLAFGFGLVTAAILALSAVGFTLQFGVSNIFNLAYGAVMTVSAFVAYIVNVHLHTSIWLAMVAGAVAGAALSVLINRLIYVPFLRRGTALFTMVMVSLAVATIVQNAIQAIAGAGFRSYTRLSESSLHFAGMILTPTQLIIIGIAVGAMIALHLLLRHTRIGKAMRATSADAELARSCGIATERVTTMAWALSGALCGMGGVALGLNLASFDFTFGNAFLLIIVAAAVFGSVGQPYGAMVGALVIGVVSEEAAIVSPSLKQVVAFAILVVILLIRPNGLWRSGFVQKMSVAAR